MLLSIFLAPVPHQQPSTSTYFSFRSSFGFILFSYSVGAGDDSPYRGSKCTGDGALTAIGAPPSTLSGSGDSVRNSVACGRGKASSASGGRTPPRRRRGAARELLRASVGGGGGSERSALLGNQERYVRWSRGASVCCVDAATEAEAEAGTGTGAGLDRVLGIASAPVAVPVFAPVVRPIPVLELEFVLVLECVLSGRGLQGSSGRRDGKNRRGGMAIVLGGGGNGDAEVPVVCAAESSNSVSPAVAPSRPDERRREVKSVKSTVRERAGTRRIEGWRVRGTADGAAAGGGPQASGEASRRVPQLSRRVERSTWRRCGGGGERWASVVAEVWSSGPVARKRTTEERR